MKYQTLFVHRIYRCYNPRSYAKPMSMRKERCASTWLPPCLQRNCFKLKLMKSYLLSIITQTWINGLALMITKSNNLDTISCQYVIEIFVSMNVTRTTMFIVEVIFNLPFNEKCHFCAMIWNKICRIVFMFFF